MLNIEFYSTQKRISSIYTPRTDIDRIYNYFSDKSIIGVDTETTGYDCYEDRVLSLQLGDGNKQFVIDTSTIPLKEFKPLLENKENTCILQNAQFDLRFFYYCNIFPEKIYDTLLAECIITGGYGDKEDIKQVKELLSADVAQQYIDRELALDALALKYCNIQLDKSIRGDIHREGLSDRVIKYGAGDVEVLPQIRNKQLAKVQEYQSKYNVGLDVLDLENEVVKVFSRMAFNGIKINPNKYTTEVIKVAKQEVEKTIQDLDNTVHEEPKLAKYRLHQGNLFFQDRTTEINWNSSVQKLKILKELYPAIVNTASPTIRKDVKHPIGKALLNYNRYKKLEAAFGEKFLSNTNKVTGRMHSSIWQILSTGRISMNNPNLLQIPARGDLGTTIRSCFIPEEGNKIVGGDYSGFELRIIAEYSQDPLWVNTFREGGDLHSILCSQTFDVPLSDVKHMFPYNKNITYRDVQKTINFGLSYGMSEYKLSSTIGVSVQQARDIIKKFFSKVPKVEKFLTQLGTLGRDRGYIKIPNPYGRIRFFPKYNVIQDFPNETESVKFAWLGEIERASKNSPIQGVNGTVIKLALIKVQKEIDKYQYPVKILLSVYDEIQTECKGAFAEEWSGILESKMIEAGQEIIKTVPIIADCSISDYWKK